MAQNLGQKFGTNGRTDGWTDRQTDRQTDKQTDRAVYRVALQLKREGQQISQKSNIKDSKEVYWINDFNETNSNLIRVCGAHILSKKLLFLI